jgi:hypothetical protein
MAPHGGISGANLGQRKIVSVGAAQHDRQFVFLVVVDRFASNVRSAN